MRTVLARVSLALCAPVLCSLAVAAVQAAAPEGRSKASDRAKLVDSAEQRWSEGGAGGTPQFTRHMIPLISKLGCNNRACHGSFQGQNGFRLSLFGHDPEMDFAELTKKDDDGGPRVDVKQPEQSLALRKPLGELDHEGGELVTAGSWQHAMLRAWVEAGAPWEEDEEAALARIEVQPAEMYFSRAEEESPVQLKVLAYFEDGTCEDVTRLTLFSTNDETVAKVSGDGTVSVAGPGDTAIVATYAGAVMTSQAIVPHQGKASEARWLADSPHRIDQLVAAKLVKLRIEPSENCGDEVFLRRVYLDLIGTLPTAEEARRFLDDKRRDRRARLIDELLERPEYSMYWATKFSDWTGNDNRFTPQPREKTGWLWHNWLRDKLERNVPYDEIVGGFLTATSREGRSLDDYVDEYKAVAKIIDDGFDEEIYPRRRTNMIFWQKATNSNADTVALQTAYAFLGVRLECAQCHKHPFDRWTQEDFQRFSAIFSVVETGMPDDVPKDMQRDLKKVDDYRYSEVWVELDKGTRRRLEERPPRLLGGRELPYDEEDYDYDPRVDLWEWMRDEDNAYFAPAIVNRLWGHYFGVGIVNPVDDFNAANPPSNPQLLAWLADDFIEHDFDLRHLHRQILNSRTYQLSWTPNETNQLDERNFSHALLRRMPAEVVMDAINQVTGGSDSYSSSNAPRDTKTINLAISRLRGGGPEYVLGIFGRPLRTQICDCERSVECGLAQAMYLLNDEDVNEKIADDDGRLADLLDELDDDGELVEELYLSVLSRRPKADELKQALEYVEAADSRAAGMQDVLWSLINVREFVFIH